MAVISLRPAKKHSTSFEKKCERSACELLLTNIQFREFDLIEQDSGCVHLDLGLSVCDGECGWVCELCGEWLRVEERKSGN